jgi:hypothetical protein
MIIRICAVTGEGHNPIIEMTYSHIEMTYSHIEMATFVSFFLLFGKHRENPLYIPTSYNERKQVLMIVKALKCIVSS